MTQKWIQNGFKMDSKWIQNGSKMNSKWIQNGFKMVSKWIQNDAMMLNLDKKEDQKNSMIFFIFYLEVNDNLQSNDSLMEKAMEKCNE